MVVFAGWEGVFELECSLIKEVLVEDADAGSNVVLTTAFYPIVDSGGLVTDDPTDVTVYRDDVALTPTTDFTIDGSEGEVTILSMGAGDDITITYLSKETVGGWKDIEVGHKNNVKRVQVGGQKTPLELKEMLMEQEIKFGEVLLDARRMNEIMGKQYPNYTLPEVQFRVQTKATGGYEYTGYCKFDSFKLSLKNDDITGHEVTAMARDLTPATT